MIELHHPVAPTRSAPPTRSLGGRRRTPTRRRDGDEKLRVLSRSDTFGAGAIDTHRRSTEGCGQVGRERERKRKERRTRHRGREKLTLRCEVLRDHDDARVALLAAPKFRTSYPPPRRGDDPSTRTIEGTGGRGEGVQRRIPAGDASTR